MGILPRAISRRIPMTFKFAAKRAAQDVLPSAKFTLDLKQRHLAFKEFELCRTVEEHLAFARKWLGGSIQKHDEITGLLKMAADISPRRVCEIGTEVGGTNYLLGACLPTVTTLIGVDLFIKNVPRLRWLRRPELQQHYVFGSSYSAKAVHQVEAVLGGELLDVLFIDGDHSYDGAKSDFLMYRHLVREGGLVVFHDIVQDHFTRGVSTESPARAGEVPLLWDELKSLYPHEEFIEQEGQDGMGIGVLRYRLSVELPAEFVSGVPAERAATLSA